MSGKQFGDLRVSIDAVRDGPTDPYYGEITLISPSGVRTTIQGGADLAMQLADHLLELAIRINQLNDASHPTKPH